MLSPGTPTRPEALQAEYQCSFAREAHRNPPAPFSTAPILGNTPVLSSKLTRGQKNQSRRTPPPFLSCSDLPPAATPKRERQEPRKKGKKETREQSQKARKKAKHACIEPEHPPPHSDARTAHCPMCKEKKVDGIPPSCTKSCSRPEISVQPVSQSVGRCWSGGVRFAAHGSRFIIETADTAVMIQSHVPAPKRRGAAYADASTASGALD